MFFKNIPITQDFKKNLIEWIIKNCMKGFVFIVSKPL